MYIAELKSATQVQPVLTRPGLSAWTTRLMVSGHVPGRLKRFWRKFVPAAVADRTNWTMAKMLSLGLSHTRTFEQSDECRRASGEMSIIVPIHDAPSVLKRCLASLQRYAAQAEIILVDDASRLPETVDIIREFSHCNSWRVLSNAKAEGHSAACNEGARSASRPYLCLLNSDTVVTPWCWHEMLEAFGSDSAIGVAGPSTSSSGTRQALDVASCCCFHWNDSQISAFAERLMAALLQPAVLDVSWVSGFAFFIRRSLWEELGGFDRDLADYGNELELCKRVANLGYRNAWVRSAYIHHLGRQSYAPAIGDQGISTRVAQGLHYIYDKHNWRPGGASSTRAARADKKW